LTPGLKEWIDTIASILEKKGRDMNGKTGLLVGLFAVLVMSGCGSKQDTTPEQAPQNKKEPDMITLQHVLIGFRGSLPGKQVQRNKDDAKIMAEEIFKRAKAGDDFDSLVKQYTDDTHPGIYTIANHGVAADLAKGVYPRGGMVPAFGDVGFSLKVGEIGMAPYDSGRSPYGWHIIKRIK
jgi:hypothetical protein